MNTKNSAIETLISKIATLKGLIEYLQSPYTDYKWIDVTYCNVGSLFRSIYMREGFQGSEESLSRLIKDSITANRKMHLASYSTLITSGSDYVLTDCDPVEFCSITGLPVGEMSKKLIEHGGFTAKELCDLENLKNPNYSDNGRLSYTSRSDVIIYVSKWIENLQKDLQELKAVQNTKVSSCHAVAKQNKNTVPVSVSL